MQVISGGRHANLAAIYSRSLKIDEERSVSRKELSQIARDAGQALDLTPSLRLVLSELVGVWGERELKGRLLVWPSNEYLVNRTGLSERMLRYGLKALIDLRVIIPKDSANGKRFGIRGQNGEIIDAYGFDLTPLYARQGEFSAEVTRQKLFRAAQRRLFDQITICRRAVEEVLQALLNEFKELSSDDLVNQLANLKALTPRRTSKAPIESLVSLWMNLQIKAEELYYYAGNGGNPCRLIESNNGSIGNTCSSGIEKEVETISPTEPEVSLIVDACPATRGYYGGKIITRRELVMAAEYLRPSLGAHLSAWNEAVGLLGGVRAAAVLFMVLQRYDDDVSSGAAKIQNPGGYFRAMCRTVADRGINLNLELMTMHRKLLVKEKGA